MTKYFIKAMSVVAFTGMMGVEAVAQQDAEKPRVSKNEEIIITRKGDKDTKVTVEIKDGEVKVNGKPLSEFKDDDITVSKRRETVTVRGYATPRSPFRGGTSFDNGELFKMNYDAVAGNKALLGVVTEKTDNGVKVNSVTKGTAAEKAGLKEDDIITKVDETAVNTPEDLTKAIGKFKPEDKTVITYKRDKKERKADITLGKRDNAAALYSGDMIRKFNDDNLKFQFDGPGMAEAFGIARGGSPRLGIKAQDTEDGKGVKVLDVDNESTAEKSGVKEGDLITEFDGKAVNSATELATAAREAKDKNLMKIKVTRDGKSQDLEIKVPKKLKTANL